MGTLVAFYSRTGITKKVAEIIADSLKCDTEEIFTTKNRSGPIGYLICGKEAMEKKPAGIKPTKKKLDEYDLVIAGTPIWGWNMSSPVRAYLELNNKDFRKLAFFCTQGGSGAERAFKDMEEVCKKKPVATLMLKTEEVNKGGYMDKVNEFIKMLKL